MTTVLIATIVVTATFKEKIFSTSAVKIGPLEFLVADVLWSIVCSVLPVLARLGLEVLFTYSEKSNHLAPHDKDIPGYLDECLQKANEITILEGQSDNSSESDEKIEDELKLHEDTITHSDIIQDDRTKLNRSSSKINDKTPNELNLQDQLSQSDKQEYDKIRTNSVLSSEWQYQTDNDNSLSEISLREVGIHFDDDMTSFESSEGGFHVNSDVGNMLEHNTYTVRQTNGNVVEKGITNPGFDGNGISKEQLNGLNRINNEIQLSNGDCQQDTDKDGRLPNGKQRFADVFSKDYDLLSNGQCIEGREQDKEIYNYAQDKDLKSNGTEHFNKYQNPESEALNQQLNFTYTNIDKVSKLWKMLPSPWFLIDPNSYKIKNENNTLTLHHKYFYLAITICVLMTMISIVISIRYGIFWTSNTTTITWLMIIFLSLFFQMFIIETLFMLFQSIYFAIILQRPTEENDVINEQKNKVWCKEEDDVRYYVDDLDDTSSPVPSPPSEEEVKKAREKAGQDRQLEEVLAMVAFDVLFLIQLVIIGFGNRDVEGYPMRVVMENNYNIAKFNMVSCSMLV